MNLLAVAYAGAALLALGILAVVAPHGIYPVLRTTALIVTLAALAAAIH
jgi:hypothetical protein